MELAHPLLPGPFISTAFPNPLPSLQRTQPFQKALKLYKFRLDPIQDQYFTLNLLLDGAISFKGIYEQCFPGAWPFSHVLSFIYSLVSSVNFSPSLGPCVVWYYQMALRCWSGCSWQWKDEVGAKVKNGAWRHQAAQGVTFWELVVNCPTTCLN